MHKPIIWGLSVFIFILIIGARPIERNITNTKVNELHLFELKIKKEIISHKNSTFRKFTYAILLARKFYQENKSLKAREYYNVAKEFNVDFSKDEVEAFLENKKTNIIPSDPELKNLIINKQFDKAFLLLPVFKLSNNYHKILYDLLFLKLVKQIPGNNQCSEILKMDIEDLNYTGLICRYLIDYLKTGKKDVTELNFIEGNLLKNDLDKLYLVKFLKEL